MDSDDHSSFADLDREGAGFAAATRSAEGAGARRRRRVAVFVPRLAIGGTERHLLEVLPKIDRQRFDVTIVTTRGPGPLDDELRQHGIRVVHAAPARRGVLSLFGSFIGIIGFLRRERPDIVHFFLPEAYIIGGLCAVLLGQRNRVMSRRSLNRYQRRRPLSALLERWLHARMDCVLANSRAVAGDLLAEGVAAAQLRTVYSGIDVGPYAAVERAAARRKLNIAEDALTFVCVANLIPYKGHRDLLDALAIAAPDLPANWQLLAVGRDDGIGSRLRDQAARLGLAAKIRWAGECANVADFLAASDIAVLASHEEGLPKSILEAMAAGLPCVVTGAGGTAEAVIDQATGIVVDVRDTQALAKALVELAGDPQQRTRFGQAGRRRVDELFGLQACVREYERVYDALLERSAVAS